MANVSGGVLFALGLAVVLGLASFLWLLLLQFGKWPFAFPPTAGAQGIQGIQGIQGPPGNIGQAGSGLPRVQITQGTTGTNNSVFTILDTETGRFFVISDPATIPSGWAGITINLPMTTDPFFADATFVFVNTSLTFSVTVNAAAGETITGAGAAVTTLTIAPRESLQVDSTDAGTWRAILQ